MPHGKISKQNEQVPLTHPEDDNSVSPSSSDSSISSHHNDDNSSHLDNTNPSAGDKQIDEVRRLVWKESQHVRRSKILVFLVIIVVGIAGSVATFFLVRKSQETGYVLAFESYAKEVAAAAESKMVTTFSVIGMLSESVTNTAILSKQTWPYVTHKNWAKVGGQAVQVSNAQGVTIVPLVPTSQQETWVNYSRSHSYWIQDALQYQGNGSADPGLISSIHTNGINVTDPPGMVHVSSDYIMPLWQRAPFVNISSVNIDLLTLAAYKHMAVDVFLGRKPLISPSQLITAYALHTKEYGSVILYPVFETFDPAAKIVGCLLSSVPWSSYFSNILIDTVKGITIVAHDNCGSPFTYNINGPNSTFLGVGDFHDTAYTKYKVDFEVAGFATYSGPSHPAYEDVSYDERFQNTSYGHAKYVLSIYPSPDFQENNPKNAAVYALGVAAIFAVILVLLGLYDFMVTRRQNRLMDTATKTEAIVSSLFPKEIRNKLMEDVEVEPNEKRGNLAEHMDTKVRGMMPANKNKPIADLFPETTIFFADIAGFTAWSSAREPAQVFMLLENIYHAFDRIAEARRVFKVETVGDCYMAVSGLPAPRKDHAVTIARFARDCLMTFNSLVKEMELSLGPDTADLGLRVGLHSGPVTAGVLRGERSRFQLFGDTVNVASRMESNGLRDKIHISQDTADILLAANKGHWVTPRYDKVRPKGKEEMQTYWLEIKSAATPTAPGSTGSSEVKSNIDDGERQDVVPGDTVKAPSVKRSPIDFDCEREKRLIDWNTDCLLGFLKEIKARRQAADNKGATDAKLRKLEQAQLNCPLDEVVEIIVLPTWEGNMTVKNADLIDMGTNVTEQLHDYIQTIANMYRKNPFHNFEHASHVAMSVIKLLARIVAPTNINASNETNLQHDLHDHTYGITSDPLIQFACAFSALIHDVDHSGATNMQLVKEKSKLAAVYNNKSVAEQNSVDLAWTLLMDPSYVDLRRAIYQDEFEFRRFRQLVVNSVMATDIMDKDLKKLRDNRWDTAFKEARDSDAHSATNRKATIVIEHLIQASDVAHTMQHWHIYRKWNERFFFEMYKAYKQGRSEMNPVDSWYRGEIGFFDFYIIPLAKKLKDCGVFGVSSDEYLNYAQRNRKEWEAKGHEVVEGMLEKVKSFDFST